MPPNSTPTEALDPGGLDEIGVAECWQLLGTQAVGRVAVILGHYPLVFPVNYALHDKSILYRTGSGTKLHSIHRSNVTFEVDSIDPVHRSGWSVMVKGVAQELSIPHNRATVTEAELAGASPWAPGERNHFIRILADEITGRRIRPGDLPPATDIRGYL
jgi:nitroimidazol reductase NimA-like FMN-containing flavoprotein (pyridoxamine 5'-phosphate oxidase superfamily)